MKYIGIIATVLIGIVIGAFMFKAGWGWFVAPLGIREIGLAESMGLSTFIGYHTKYMNIDQDSDKSTGERLATIMVIQLSFFAIMYVISRFI
jgi:hypothetical protein